LKTGYCWFEIVVRGRGNESVHTRSMAVREQEADNYFIGLEC